MKRFSFLLFILLLPLSVSAAGWVEQESGTMQSLRGVAKTSESLVAVGNSGNMMRSQDNGSSWSLVDKFSSSWWHDLVELNDKLFAVGESGGYAVSEDHGLTWTPFSLGLSNHFYAIDRSEDYGYIVGSGGSALYFLENSNTWASATTNITNDINDIYDMGNGTAWAVTDGGRLLYVTNSGISWTDLGQVDSDHLNGVYFESGSKGWVIGDNGTIKVTQDGGSGWTTLSIDDLGSQDLYGIEAYGDSLVVVGDEIVLTSFDGGDVWETYDFSDENLTFYSAHFDSGGSLWVAGTNFDVRSSVYFYDNVGPSAPENLSLASEGVVGEDLSVTWSASEDDAGTVGYWISINESDAQEIGNVLEYEIGSFDEGEHTVNVYAVDPHGNVGEMASIGFELSSTEEDESIDDGEVEMGNLITLACADDSDSTDPCRAVYYYASDGMRHAFPNEKVFFTWFDDFDLVVEISDEFMSSLRLGSNVTYHPGTKMVKFLSVPTVYAVAQHGELRAIASEEVAMALYGPQWNTLIDDISDAFIGNYSFGESIESADNYDVEAHRSSVSTLDDNF